MSGRRGGSAGFTLIEMMVVIVILVILLAIGAPSYQTFVLNTQVRSTAEGLLTGLNLARTEAIRRNTPVTFWLVDGFTADCQLTTAGSSWIVSIDDPTGRCNVAPSDTNAPRLIQSRAGSEAGGNLTVAATGGRCMTFNSFGGIAATCPGILGPVARFTRIDADPPTGTGASTLRIEMGDGGSVRLCDPDAYTGRASRCMTVEEE